MPSCPRCGQSYSEGLKFCLYCEYDLSLGPGGPTSPSTSPPAAGASPRLPSRRRALGTLLVAVVVAIIALYVLRVIVGGA